MKSVMLIAMVMLSTLCRAENTPAQKWDAEAKEVTIVRDDWGVAHVYGKTDADTVFGMIYAQCEDDFDRVETNYLNAMGRLAETEGEGKVYQDLRMKMFIDPDGLEERLCREPGVAGKLMDAFADGANFYLAKHPQVKPRVIHASRPGWLFRLPKAASGATSRKWT